MFLKPELQNRFLPFLTSKQIAEMQDKDKAVIVLPIASIEQHGPHMPVFTDSIICEEVLARSLKLLPDSFPIWVLPLLPYAKSNEHAGFAGTFTLTSETLIKVLKEIGDNVARNGFRRFAILNAHGGNTEIIDFVIRDIREKTNLLVFALHIGLRVALPSEGLSEMEKVYGIHAGDAETSMLLHCSPDLVRREFAPNGLPSHLEEMDTPPFMGALNFAWLTRDIAPLGVLGDATVATPEKGSKFLTDAAAEVAGLFKKIKDFEFKSWQT
jgi:creatinine amidohydrolase